MWDSKGHNFHLHVYSVYVQRVKLPIQDSFVFKTECLEMVFAHLHFLFKGL